MDLYGQKGASLPQKAVILTSELGLLVVSYLVLFGPLLRGLRAFGESPSRTRNAILFVFNLVVVARFMWTLFVFLRRRIPWEEAVSVPCAFALYLLGFPLLTQPARVDTGILEWIGIVLFVAGSFINTYSEHQRKRYKQQPENQGRLYTAGLFSVSMHPNYFGDLLWVSGYACVTHSAYAWIIPAFLFCFFYFYNIPKLDQHLRTHYCASFTDYERRTKRLIPFIL